MPDIGVTPPPIPLWACIPISEETPQISYKYTFFHTAANSNSNSNFILLCIFMNLFCFLYHYSHSDIIRTWCRQPTAPHSKLPDTLGLCLGIFPGRQAGRAVPAPAQLSPSAQPQEVVVLLLVLVLGDARLRLLFSAHIRAALREARNKSSSKWFSGDKFEGRGERGPQSRRYGDWFVIGFPLLRLLPPPRLLLSCLLHWLHISISSYDDDQNGASNFHGGSPALMKTDRCV